MPVVADTKSKVAPLAGTTWRLIEIQSMSDEVGAKKPDDPSKYTMHLKGDGGIEMKLNCNSATGSWSAEPGSDGTSGSFSFTTFTASNSTCPPPSLDGEISRQAQYIRSYLIKEGRLNLSLMADGGIWVWEKSGN